MNFIFSQLKSADFFPKTPSPKPARIPPQTLLPFCPSERQVSFLPREARQSGILFKKGSSGVQ